jgi:hypothetical protein
VVEAPRESAGRAGHGDRPDLTALCPDPADLGSALHRYSILDGELVAFEEGRELRCPPCALMAGRGHPILLASAPVAFIDLWTANGLTYQPYTARRGALDGLGLKDERWPSTYRAARGPHAG